MCPLHAWLLPNKSENDLDSAFCVNFLKYSDVIPKQESIKMHQERGMEEGDKGEKCAEREIYGDT
jgi:hypothetical protein